MICHRIRICELCVRRCWTVQSRDYRFGRHTSCCQGQHSAFANINEVRQVCGTG